jgi:hypothetical protein
MATRQRRQRHHRIGRAAPGTEFRPDRVGKQPGASSCPCWQCSNKSGGAGSLRPAQPLLSWFGSL